MPTNFNINAQSTPLYDTFGWADYWSCDDWINWHKALVSAYGTKVADEKWASAWLAGLSKLSGGYGTASGTSVFGNDAVPVDCRTFNSAFRDYVNARPVLKTAVFTGVGGFVGGIVSGGVHLTESVAEGIGNIGKTAKYLKVIIPLVAITALAWVGYKIYREVSFKN